MAPREEFSRGLDKPTMSMAFKEENPKVQWRFEKHPTLSMASREEERETTY